jgi:hypothetical protein
MRKENVHRLGSLQISAPEAWLDVTKEIEEHDPPLTLARTDGVGVIQFSVAEFRSGKSPSITLDTLNDLLHDFARSRELGLAFDSCSLQNTVLISSASFHANNRYWRVFYCSDGQNVVLATYNCCLGEEDIEMKDCESIIEKLKFTHQ